MARLIAAFIVAIVIGLATHPAAAQQPGNIPRIGYLDANPISDGMARSEAFRRGLRERGYVERKIIIIVWRSVEGKRDRLPDLAAELVRLGVDIIVTAGASTTRAAKKATSEIPIVIAQHSDPVGAGFVASLARPGGNITGLSTLAPEISSKQIQLLKDINPKLSRVWVIGTSTRPGNAQALGEIERAAEALGVEIKYHDVLNAKDVVPAFAAARRTRAEAILVLAGRILMRQRT